MLLNPNKGNAMVVMAKINYEEKWRITSA